MNLITRGTPLFRRVLLVIALTVSAVLVSGCGEPDHIYLPALQADPMADYSHPDLDREVQFATKKHTDWKGVENSADIATFYIVDEAADVEAVMADILHRAELAGWAVRNVEPSIPSNPLWADERWWRADKYFKEGLARLAVRYEPSDRLEGRTEIWMSLGFVEEDIPIPLLSVRRDDRYTHASDLRDALEAAGVRCRLYTNQTKAEIRACNEYVTIGVFGDQEEAAAAARDRMNSGEGGSSVEYVVGENWMVELSGGSGLGPYVVEELGGELLGTEAGD